MSISVLPPIFEGPELVYLQRPGELCGGGVRKQKVFLSITGTCLYESHSKKAYMPVEGPMMLLLSSGKQVSVKDFLNPFVYNVGVDKLFIE